MKIIRVAWPEGSSSAVAEAMADEGQWQWQFRPAILPAPSFRHLLRKLRRSKKLRRTGCSVGRGMAGSDDTH